MILQKNKKLEKAKVLLDTWHLSSNFILYPGNNRDMQNIPKN